MGLLSTCKLWTHALCFCDFKEGLSSHPFLEPAKHEDWALPILIKLFGPSGCEPHLRAVEYQLWHVSPSSVHADAGASGDWGRGGGWQGMTPLLCLSGNFVVLFNLRDPRCLGYVPPVWVSDTLPEGWVCKEWQTSLHLLSTLVQFASYKNSFGFFLGLAGGEEL